MEDIVMEALSSPRTTDQIRGAAELCSLTGKQKHKLVDNGIIQPLLCMVQSCEFDAAESALLALLSLAYGSERNKIKIAKCGAIPILLAMLRTHSQLNDDALSLAELGIAALFILSCSICNRLLIASTGAIPILLEIIGKEQLDVSVQAKLDVIATLQNLSACKPIIPSLVSSGLPIYLLNILYDSDKTSNLVEKAIALLERIVSSSEMALKATAAVDGAIQALVEAIEEGSIQSKEHAVGILLLICQNSRDEYRGVLLREGVMPGLLQLTVDGSRRAKNLARTLLLLLRDGPRKWSNGKQLKNEVLEHIMERIDAEEDGSNATALSLVQQMIAKLHA